MSFNLRKISPFFREGTLFFFDIFNFIKGNHIMATTTKKVYSGPLLTKHRLLSIFQSVMHMLTIVVVQKWKQLHTPTQVITQLNFINRAGLRLCSLFFRSITCFIN